MTRLVLILLKCVAWLPMKALYVIADLIYVLIYYVAGYRRKVVEDNMARCFPDRSAEERRRLEKDFYRNFADYIMETVKLFHISDSEMERRMKFRNIEIIDSLVRQGRSVAVYFSHCGNWEWAPSVTLHAARRPGDGVEYCQVYRPLSSHVFDALMLRARSRFGSLSLPKATVLRELIRLRRDGILNVTGFMSDQKPSHGDPALPLMFLNRPTAFITGTEELARRMGMAAVYWDMYKTGRGYYEIDCRLLAENVADTERGDVTRAYASVLEETIERNPSIWLWTHKRWKHPVELPR